MKICLLTYRGNPYSGGQGIYIYYLARELQRMGHEVDVISSQPFPELSEGITLHRLKSSSIYHRDTSFKKNFLKGRSLTDFGELFTTKYGIFSDPLAFSVRAYAKVKELCKSRKFDIIHDNQGLGYALLLMKNLGIPVIATIHHPLTIDKQADLEQADGLRSKWGVRMFYLLTHMQAFVARRLDRVITVSQSSAKEITRSFKVNPDKLRVVYNGTDTDIFQPIEEETSNKNGLIMVGNTDDRKKGVIYLLKALQLLADDRVRLNIVDDPWQRSPHGDEVEPPPPSYSLRMLEKFGVDGLVSFTGRLTKEELARQYSRAEIAVVPSLYEGFGFPASEAMACGVPVIASSGGALPEVVGNAGILVPPGEPGPLAEAIKRLLKDKQLQQKLGEAGRRRVQQEFSWEQAANKTVKVYQELL
jgi:glycosyltransferase involved in cell wall biosynthesis